MPIKVPARMKYISRIDADYTHCWYVRAGYGFKEATNKTFSDSLYGGKGKALIAAMKWRDKEIKKLKPKIIAWQEKQNRHFGKGYHVAVDNRFDPPKESWRATYWSKKLGRQLTKTFSINRYGNARAKKLAKQWRNFMLTGEL